MVEIRRMGPRIGVEVTGVDVNALDDAGFAPIYQAWLDCNVMVVRDQELTIDQFLHYSRRFGIVVPHPSKSTRHPDVPEITLLVRLKNGASVAALRKLALAVRPDAALPVITDVEQHIDETAAEPRFTMVVLITFAALSVILAATGLYGVIAYTVAQRTREIGIRLALGATRAAIARLVVGNGLRLAASGVVVGLIGAVAATRVIEHLLYRVSYLDPFSFVGGAALLIAVSVAACIVPMLRATSVDPIVAVRAD